MYNSPIAIFSVAEEIVNQITEEKNRIIMESINKVGIDINKEELIRALSYDRNQYNKGYADGCEEEHKKLKEAIEKVKNTAKGLIIRDSYGEGYMDGLLLCIDILEGK